MPLRPLIREFVAVEVKAPRIEEENTAAALMLAQEDRAVPMPRLDRAAVARARGGVRYPKEELREAVIRRGTPYL